MLTGCCHQQSVSLPALTSYVDISRPLTTSAVFIFLLPNLMFPCIVVCRSPSSSAPTTQSPGPTQPAPTTPPVHVDAPPPVQANPNEPALIPVPPGPVTVLPEPPTAPAPTQAPPMPIVLRSTVDLVIGGVSTDTFPSKQSELISIVAQAAGVPTDDVSVLFGTSAGPLVHHSPDRVLAPVMIFCTIATAA